MAWQAVFVVFMVGLTCFIWTRERPERLQHSFSGNYRIAQDKMYQLITHSGYMPRDSKMLIEVQEMRGTNAWMLVEEREPFQFINHNTFNVFTIEGDSLYYALEPRPWRPNFGKGYAGGDVNAVPTRQMVDATPTEQTAPVTKTVRFRKVALRGGPSQDLMTLQGERFCLVGSHVFWLRSSQTPGVGTSPRPPQPRSDLMLTSLADGSTHCIRTGIASNTTLVGGETGVSWKEFAPASSTAMLFYSSVSDGSPRLLETTEGTQAPPRCLEYRDRVYWMAERPEKERTVAPHPALMSAGRESADRREVCAQMEKHRVADLSLHLYQGNLYCCLAEAPTAEEGDAKGAHDLCCVHPERSDPMEILYRLPQRSLEYHFDEGYFYFGVERDACYRFRLHP